MQAAAGSSAYTAAQSAVIELAHLHGLNVVGDNQGKSQIIVPASPSAEVRLQTAKAWLRASELRRGVFGDQFGADPAWDMLLDIYVHGRSRSPVSVSSACLASFVPATTALRWIAKLVAKKWLNRVPDPRDARRTHLHLPAEAVASIESALDAAVASDRRYGFQRMCLVQKVDCI